MPTTYGTAFATPIDIASVAALDPPQRMNANNQDIEALAAMIRGYVLEHPNAADTVEGVARWWVGGDASDAWLRRVQGAIEQLIDQHMMARRTLRDGTVIYERNRDDLQA